MDLTPKSVESSEKCVIILLAVLPDFVIALFLNAVNC